MVLLDASLLIYAVDRRAEQHQQAAAWLATSVAWIPTPGADYPRILGELITTYDLRGNLVPDAALAALAIEHRVPVVSADTDFARLKELHWQNPLA